MNTRLAAALALLICLAGAPKIWRDLRTGESRLWLGGKPVAVTKAGNPILFWTVAGGQGALVVCLTAVCLVLLVTAR